VWRRGRERDEIPVRMKRRDLSRLFALQFALQFAHRFAHRFARGFARLSACAGQRN